MGTARAGDGDTLDGDVPTPMLTAQMDVLNTAFAPLGISFVVAGVDKFTNASVRAHRCPALRHARIPATPLVTLKPGSCMHLERCPAHLDKPWPRNV